jgi:hypothetical protein
MAVDEWIYYSRNGSIRRIRENGQQDQAVSGVITGSDSFRDSMQVAIIFFTGRKTTNSSEHFLTGGTRLK